MTLDTGTDARRSFQPSRRGRWDREFETPEVTAKATAEATREGTTRKTFPVDSATKTAEKRMLL